VRPLPAAARPLPAELQVTLDGRLRHGADGVLIGGSPRRLLRLSTAGRQALRELAQGRAESPSARLLARRLVDAGIAHPHPAPRDPRGLVTVVIPVWDRARELARCLEALGEGVAVTIVDDGSQREGEAIAALAARHGARLIRRPRCGGPAAARNAALDQVESEIVAFLDSDCVPSREWLGSLVGHFADPAVGAVAPRVRAVGACAPPRVRSVAGGAPWAPSEPVEAGAPRAPSGPIAGGAPPRRRGAIARYLAARSPLDMGARPAAVRPGAAVAYVPSAALLVRRSALGAGFDESLRYGEDVDLVWRLHDAGWSVRYDPAVTVEHDEPRGLGAMLARRFHYGCSAAPLAARHGRRVAPSALQRAAVAGTALALCGRPRVGGALVLADGLLFARGMRRRGVPLDAAVGWFAKASGQTLLRLGSPADTLGVPAVLLIATRRRARVALGLLALPALLQAGAGGELDPLRATALGLLDDLAYAAGVWRGAIAHRQARALVPALSARRG
jgi:mycofactocin glycosyltransferase